jgi:glycosyltransferase involved in cell wall biosynthesis
MISFIIPAYNEQKNVKPTIGEIIKAVKFLKLKNYEIIFVDDCSTDNTLKIAKDLNNKKKLNIKIIHNKQNLGWGGTVKKGIKNARKKFVVWVPGDNGFNYKQYVKIISQIKNYHFVSSYFINANERIFYRYVFTSTYTPLLNAIFNLNFPYYNGLTIFKTSILKKVNIKFNSHIFQVEIWSKLKLQNLLSEVKFVQLRNREKTQISQAFKLKNATKVTLSFFYVIFNFWIKKIFNFLR